MSKPDNTQIAIRVPTATLKDLFKDMPDALVELERSAVEKVAEELDRKVTRAMEGRIAIYARKLEEKATNDLRKTYTFPHEVKVTIRDIVSQTAQVVIEEHLRNAKRTLDDYAKAKIDDGVKVLQEAIDDAYDKRVAQLEGTIRELARKEFFAVLAEVKGATA